VARVVRPGADTTGAIDAGYQQSVLPGEGSAMSKLLRGVVAGWGAKKLGGCGCGGILLFILFWWLLGHSGISLFQ
jgi:hypothetical protein